MIGVTWYYLMGISRSVLKGSYTSAGYFCKMKKCRFFLGGEHLITFPIVKAMLDFYPDLAVLHFDAHADLRNDYLGETYSHATVMRRVCELVGPENGIPVWDPFRNQGKSLLMGITLRIFIPLRFWLDLNLHCLV